MQLLQTGLWEIRHASNSPNERRMMEMPFAQRLSDGCSIDPSLRYGEAAVSAMKGGVGRSPGSLWARPTS